MLSLTPTTINEDGSAESISLMGNFMPSENIVVPITSEDDSATGTIRKS